MFLECEQEHDHHYRLFDVPQHILQLKCHRLFRPQFRKVKTSFFAEIRQVSDTLTPHGAFQIIDGCDKMPDAFSRLGNMLTVIEMSLFLLENSNRFLKCHRLFRPQFRKIL